MIWHTYTVKGLHHLVNYYIHYLMLTVFLSACFKFYSLKKSQLCNKVSSTILTMLYGRSSEFTNLLTEILNPLTNFSLVPYLYLLATTFLLCFNEFYLFFFLDSAYWWYHAVFVFLISFSIILFWFICVVTNDRMSFFFPYLVSFTCDENS